MNSERRLLQLQSSETSHQQRIFPQAGDLPTIQTPVSQVHDLAKVEPERNVFRFHLVANIVSAQIRLCNLVRTLLYNWIREVQYKTL